MIDPGIPLTHDQLRRTLRGEPDGPPCGGEVHATGSYFERTRPGGPLVRVWVSCCPRYDAVIFTRPSERPPAWRYLSRPRGGCSLLRPRRPGP